MKAIMFKKNKLNCQIMDILLKPFYYPVCGRSIVMKNFLFQALRVKCISRNYIRFFSLLTFMSSVHLLFGEYLFNWNYFSWQLVLIGISDVIILILHAFQVLYFQEWYLLIVPNIIEELNYWRDRTENF